MENLESQIVSLKNTLEQVNAEKVALDQTFVEILKQSIQNKKELVLMGNNVNALCGQISTLKAEKAELENRVKELQVISDESLEVTP